MKLNIDLSTLALILWAGMLIIAGSIWVLCSQVRKLADILEERAKAMARQEANGSLASLSAANVRTGVRNPQAPAVRVRVSGHASLAASAESRARA